MKWGGVWGGFDFFETCSGSELLWHLSYFLFLSFSHVLGWESHRDATVRSFSLGGSLKQAWDLGLFCVVRYCAW